MNKNLKKTLTTIILAVFFIINDINVFAADAPRIVVGNTTCKTGESISIPVTIENNSGIIALYCNIEYDNEKVKLVSVDNGTVLTDPSHSGSIDTNPFRLCFDMSLSVENNTSNGVITTLNFDVLPDAEIGETTITLSYDPDEIYDYNLNNVHFEVINGILSITSDDKKESNEEIVETTTTVYEESSEEAAEVMTTIPTEPETSDESVESVNNGLLFSNIIILPVAIIIISILAVIIIKIKKRKNS
jgi:hypothetical protein